MSSTGNTMHEITKSKRIREGLWKNNRRLKCELDAYKKGRGLLMWKNFIAFFAVIGLSLIYYKYTYQKPLCSSPFDSEDITNELHSKLYGQNEAISTIESALAGNYYSKKILVFIGGTGVGKTWTSTILQEKMNIPKETMLTINSYKSFVDKGSIEKCSNCSNCVIVLDDLYLNDANDSVHLLNHILKSNVSIYTLNIILIFNTDNLDFKTPTPKYHAEAISHINSYIMPFNIPIFYVKFYQLKECDLEMCARDALSLYYLYPSDDRIKSLLQISNYTNCKKIYSKSVLID